LTNFTTLKIEAQIPSKHRTLSTILYIA
jgi:hypothetical protein